MKARYLALATAAVALAIPGLASAETITFDDTLASYAPLGIVFGPGFSSQQTNTFGGAVNIPGPNNYGTFDTTSATINFTSLTSTFGFTALGLNPGGGFYDGATVTAFNLLGDVLGTQIIGTAGPDELRTPFTFAFAPPGGGISRVVFDSRVTNSSGGLFGFDNVTFDATAAAVPEPATWGMMILGFGMIGFGLRSRRKSNVTTRVAFN